MHVADVSEELEDAAYKPPHPIPDDGVKAVHHEQTKLHHSDDKCPNTYS